MYASCLLMLNVWVSLFFMITLTGVSMTVWLEPKLLHSLSLLVFALFAVFNISYIFPFFPISFLLFLNRPSYSKYVLFSQCSWIFLTHVFSYLSDHAWKNSRTIIRSSLNGAMLECSSFRNQDQIGPCSSKSSMDPSLFLCWVMLIKLL